MLDTLFQVTATSWLANLNTRKNLSNSLFFVTVFTLYFLLQSYKNWRHQLHGLISLIKMGQFCPIAFIEPADTMLPLNIFVSFCIFGIVLCIDLWCKISDMSSMGWNLSLIGSFHVQLTKRYPQNSLSVNRF